MKQRYLIRALAWTLAALTALALIACGSGNGQMQSSENIVYMTKAPHVTAGPNQGGSPSSETAAASAPGTAAVGTPASEKPATPLPTATPVPSPVPGKLLDDGEYKVFIYSDMTTDQSGCVWVMVGELKYQELSDGIISTTEVGDVLTLRSYSFEVMDIDRIEKNGVPMIRFNDGTECCVYIRETDSWRFIWPNGEPYTYEDERYMMPLAVDVSLTDELTPHAEGRNVYGDLAGNDPAIGILDDLQDFFRHYRGLKSEYADIIVYGGEITSVVIPYHE